MKKRVAYVSPLPPAESGISFYSQELLDYLDDYYTITLVTDQKEVLLNKKFPLISSREFLDSFRQFDRVIYNIGNSPFHSTMVGMLEEVPGVVILHDTYLPDLINYIDRKNIIKNILYEDLYFCHGWKALKDSQNFQNYQLNCRVINLSVGVILHSNYSMQTLAKAYGNIDSSKFEIIPMVRKPEDIYTSSKPLICSFGHINGQKLEKEIVEAFFRSNLSKEKDSMLIFVGGYSTKEHLKQVYETAEKYGSKEKVKITGFVSDETYRQYIKECMFAIQLREYSRGEVSKAVLDLFSYGKPVILNRAFSFTDYPEDIAFFVSEKPSVEELSRAIDSVYTDRHLREKISANAFEYVSQNHDPKKVVKKLYQAVEKLYHQDRTITLLNLLSRCSVPDLPHIVEDFFEKNVQNHRILFDVSVVAVNDLKTGIQRVVKAQLKHLIDSPPDGFVVEPVRLSDERGKWEIFFARDFCYKFLNLNLPYLPADETVNFKPSDVYFCSDLNGGGVVEAYRAGLYQTIKDRGVKVVFMVYDLLPVKLPQYFPSQEAENFKRWLEVVLQVADGIVTISNAVKKELLEFCQQQGISFDPDRIFPVHLGYDFKVAQHQKEVSAGEKELVEKLAGRDYFLMVSTVEPRKGHMQTIKAFEMLWQEGYDYPLVIVGKEGWMVDRLMSYIKTHPQLGKKLFYAGYVSDTTLETLYKNARATIVASEGEGFGLSVVESLAYGTPVIARDIEVFREVAGDYGYYFENTKDPSVIKKAIQEFLTHKKTAINYRPPTWMEHAEKIKSILTGLFNR